MALARIRRIKRIGNYRLFQNWTDEGLPNKFARVNLVYGQNGSGKSTLANLFRECSVVDIATPAAVLELEVEQAGSLSLVSEADQLFWPRVQVFNADYVRDNLRFDDASGPSPDSLLTLGKPNVDAEARLKIANERLAEIQPKLRPAQRDAQSAEGSLDRRMTEVARSVVDDLRNSSVANYRATNTYTKANVRTILEGDQAMLDGASADISVDLATALSSTMATPTLAPREAMSGGEAVHSARGLLSTGVVVKVIETLRDHPERAKWVQNGIALHEGLETCLYCGQLLTERRKEYLTAHFDTALTTLQGAIGDLVDTRAQVRAGEQLRNLGQARVVGHQGGIGAAQDGRVHRGESPCLRRGLMAGRGVPRPSAAITCASRLRRASSVIGRT